MITGSVTPGIAAFGPSWPACKEKLFAKLVAEVKPEEKARIEEAPKRSFQEILEAIAILSSVIPQGSKLFNQKYVDNLHRHFETHTYDAVYLHELVEDFKFKAVKKLMPKNKELSPIPEDGQKNVIIQDIFQQMDASHVRCAARVRDLTYNSTHPVHTIDRYGVDFLAPEYGHCLELKKDYASQLSGKEDIQGPLGPNKFTAIISQKKLQKLLNQRNILVIGRDMETGHRAVCVAALPDFFFNEKVESRHLYRGMENYPPQGIYYLDGKHHTVWYSIVGDKSEPVSI